MEEIENPKENTLVLIILFGLLSVICAEVFSGSSPLWMYNFWGLFVVLPLYWGHGLILWNIALRFRKTSLTHLYLLGIIYGLYESWMTKVIWAGYMDSQEPQFGQFLGFAIGEFLVIALFWHAVFSFIMPIMVFHILGNKNPSFRITKARWVIFGAVILIASLFIPSGLNFDIGATLVAYCTNMVLLLAFIYLARKSNPNGFMLDSLRLGKRGIGITVGYIAFLYVFLFFWILPERIAPPLTILLTVLFYCIIIALFSFSREGSFIEDLLTSGFTSRHVLYGIIAVGIMILVWFVIFATGIPSLLGVFVYLGMLVAGPCLFILAIIKIVTNKL